MPLSMLIDTGAKFSCISQICLDAIETTNATKYPRAPSEVNLVGAGNDVLNCKQIAHVPFTFKHAKVTWPVYVVDGLQPPLLAGMDILSYMGARVDATKGTVTFTQASSATANNAILLIASQDMTVDPVSTATIPARAAFKDTNAPARDYTGIAESLYQGILPGIAATNAQGMTTIAAVNATASPRDISRGDVLGTLTPAETEESAWMSMQQAIAAITAAPICPVQLPAQQQAAADRPQAPAQRLTADQRKKILQPKLNIKCPAAWHHKYLDLLLEFQDVFSLNDADLGHTTAYEHKIELTSDNPVHVKQFRIPLAQQQFIYNRVKELANLRVIEPSTSPYNTPIFAVPKKSVPGEPQQFRLIQDLRPLNALTKTDKHSICDVRACLDRIGQLNASVFSSIDLRAGYYQLGLAKESRPLTAFTLPLLGQWQWKVTTMGLSGAPASFSKLMEKVMAGLDFILRYLDDLLAASRDHDLHLHHLRAALERLRQFNLKINPEKSTFGSKTVEYLGHTVSTEGFTVGEHKFRAIKEFPVPATKKRVQQFLGLANFFRQLIPNFQSHAGHLSALLSRDNAWKCGELPPKANLAFHTLQQALLTRPVVAFPDPNQPFVLATDAAAGDDDNPGGLGAVLTQRIDGHDRVIAYASRALKHHEKSQSAFQLELQAVIWALDHFGPYLRHGSLKVVTDHKPVANLSQQQLKSLHRLHEKMLEFPCIIQYRPGILNDVADALSRNSASITAVTQVPDLGPLQAQDRLCRLITAIKNGDARAAAERPDLAQLANRFTTYSGLLAIHDPTGDFDGRRIVAPAPARPNIMAAAHDHPLAGHKGRDKTIATIKTRYWWPTLSTDVAAYVANCATCQKSKDPPNLAHRMPIHPLPVPEMPNDRVHADLFGPLPASTHGNRWILTMTCAFSKFVRIVALPNKETKTVAEAILGHWIAVFGPMKRLVHDQGREFHSKLLKELLEGLGIEPKTTSAMAPSVNGEAEIFNKWIASYLKAMSSKAGEEWEGRLAALNLAYNSAIHSAHRRQPGAVMFGRRFHLPQLEPAPAPPAAAPWARQQQHQLHAAWQDVHQCLDAAGKRMQTQQTNTRIFTPLQGERVLLHYPRTALASQGPPKLQQQWKEAAILAQLGPATFLARLRFSNQRPTVVHGNRIKPFFPRLILPPRQWCADPDQRAPAPTAALRPAQGNSSSCPDYCPCRSARGPKKNSRQRNSRQGKLPPKRRRRKRARQPPVFHNQPDEEDDQPPEPVYLRHAHRQHPQQSPPPYWLRSSPIKDLLDYSEASTTFHSARDSSTPSTSPSPPATRSASLRFPRALPKHLVPRALQRLSTKLKGWKNPVPSSSSSSTTSPETGSGSSTETEEQHQPLATSTPAAQSRRPAPPGPTPRHAAAAATAVLAAAILGCVALAAVPQAAAAAYRPTRTPTQRHSLSPAAAAQRIAIANITDQPQLAFSPVGTVLPVGAFARMVIHINMSALVDSCDSAINAMPHWNQLLTDNSWARQHMEESRQAQLVYIQSRHRLKNACTSLTEWDSPSNFFRTEPLGQDNHRKPRGAPAHADLPPDLHRASIAAIDISPNSTRSRRDAGMPANLLAIAEHASGTNNTSMAIQHLITSYQSAADSLLVPDHISPDLTDLEKKQLQEEEDKLTHQFANLIHFGTVTPQLQQHQPSGTDTALARVPRALPAIIAAGIGIGKVIVKIVGGAFFLYQIAAMLFGGSDPAWEQIAKPAARTANGAATNAKALQGLAKTLDSAYYFDHFYMLVNAMRAHADAICNLVYHVHEALYELQQGTISALFATPKEISNALAAVAKKANAERMTLAVNTVADVLLLPAFGIKSPGTLSIIVPLPVATAEFKLHRFAGTPLLTTTNDQLSLVVPQPDHEAIAVSPKSSDHILVNQPDLDTCFRVKNTYMCAELPIRYRREDSCLGSLFAANAKAIHDRCNFKPHMEEWHVAHTDKGSYVLTTPTHMTATTTCNGGASYAVPIAPGSYRLTIPPGCHTQTPHFGITTPLAKFAKVEVFKEISWDMHAPLIGNNSRFHIEFRNTEAHAALAASQLYHAETELATAIQEHSTPWWHHLIGPAVVLSIGIAIATICWFRFAALRRTVTSFVTGQAAHAQPAATGTYDAPIIRNSIAAAALPAFAPRDGATATVSPGIMQAHYHFSASN